jgi:hypothetical protein
MTAYASTVATGNELAAYFRQRQAMEDGDRWYGGSSYQGEIDLWVEWPEWLNPGCDDRYSALDAGRCCRDSDTMAIRMALTLSDLARETLASFGRGEQDCEAAAGDLAPLVALVPQTVAAVRAELGGADRVRAVQLGCALDRVALLIGRLSMEGRCPWRCDQHGHCDLGPGLAPLRARVEECSGAIWDALHPRDRALAA